MIEHALSNPYLSMLERWVRSAMQHVFRVKDRPDLQCYGTGFGSWGVQTNQKAFAAFATLAAALPGAELAAAGTQRFVQRMQTKVLYRAGCSGNRGAGTALEEIVPFDSSWANAEDPVGIVIAYGGGLQLYRPGRRNIAPKRYPWTGHDELLGTLYADSLCVDVKLGLQMREPGDLFYDLGAVVRSGDSGEETKAFAAGGAVRLSADEKLRLVQVRDAEDVTHLLAWNVSDEAVETALPELKEGAVWQEIAACMDGSAAPQREADGRIRMEAGDLRLFRIS